MFLIDRTSENKRDQALTKNFFASRNHMNFLCIFGTPYKSTR
jgi:hypothetical protein